MIDIGGTIKQVRQACDHLANEYKTLAEGAIPALDSLNSTIGRLTQWECRYRGQLPTTDAMLFDTKPNWFERTFGGIEPIKEVPHPRADEARQAAKELFGSIGANDAQFGLDVADIVDTPKAVSAMMEKWLTVADGFSRDVNAAIPSNPAYIPTRCGLEGWLGDAATNAYGTTVSSQNSAAATTES